LSLGDNETIMLNRCSARFRFYCNWSKYELHCC